MACAARRTHTRSCTARARTRARTQPPAVHRRSQANTHAQSTGARTRAYAFRHPRTRMFRRLRTRKKTPTCSRARAWTRALSPGTFARNDGRPEA
eukprot:5275018-Pleurochrysis_carterae.AAC.2